MRTMTARYAGVCRVCGKGIRPGMEIKWWGHSKTTHAVCPPGKVAITCPSEASGDPGKKGQLSLNYSLPF